jgi:hypothetical protein
MTRQSGVFQNSFLENNPDITDKISQQPENCENRNDPDLVQAFLKKWWVESDFKAPTPLPPFHYGVKMYKDRVSTKMSKMFFINV